MAFLFQHIGNLLPKSATWLPQDGLSSCETHQPQVPVVMGFATAQPILRIRFLASIV
jgi:hypothetical protein